MTAEQIKAIRERLGETHGQFAERFGVARTTIIYWENGNVPTFGPTARYVERILAELEGDDVDNGADRATETLGERK